MEKVIQCGFGLLLALTLPIWSVQGEQAPADDRSDFDVVPENAARAVLLHAATPECDTVRCSLSIDAGQPRARGNYEILLSSNQYTDRTPTIVTEEGTSLTWLRSSSSESWSNGITTRICRHFYRFSPAKKGEYRLRCRDLSFDGVAYDGVLTIQVGAPELNAVPTFLLWVAGIGCLLLVEVFIRIGCRNEARGDTADFIRRHRRLPLNAEGIWTHYLLPIMLLYLPLFLAFITLTGMASISTNVLLWIATVCVPVAFVLFRLQYRRLFFRWRKRCCRQSGSTLCFGSWPSSTTGRSTTWTGIFLSHTPIPHGGAPRGVNRSSLRTTAAASGSTASMTSASAVRSSRLDIPAGTSAG